jgi:UDP-N-acetylmuramate: L-alanyl-gamma-D-glutamyl-meso-diaminopimelate ligase
MANPKRVHLMGIGGSAMVHLARMFQTLGWTVQGSDRVIYPPASDFLEEMNIQLFEGYSADNLDPELDLVIVGNVIARNNPEAQALMDMELAYMSMPEAIYSFLMKDYQRLMVTGTHGKTTSSSLLAWIFTDAGLDPGYFIGGVPKNLQQGFHKGQGSYFVLEGDEYDTSFFEKTPKFLHYGPQHVMITSIEFDHADIYKNLAHILEQFEKLVDQISPDGSLVAYAPSAEVRKVADRFGQDVIWYSDGPSTDFSVDYYATDVKQDKGKQFFTIMHRQQALGKIETHLWGQHNVANIVGCVAMALNQGLAFDAIAKAIRSFEGARKRQDFLGEENGVAVYEDYAHHPTAIAKTIAGFAPQAKSRGGRLWAIFEPGSNTVRRKFFQDVLPQSFQGADVAIISKAHQKADNLAEDQRLDGAKVANDIAASGLRAHYEEPEVVLNRLCEEVTPNDVVLFMTYGKFEDVPRRLVKALKEKSG